MKFNPDYLYVIKIVSKSISLTYTAKIISNDDNFITFIDIYNKEYSFNIRNIVSIECLKKEVKNGVPEFTD